jgi:hypothetical protein
MFPHWIFLGIISIGFLSISSLIGMVLGIIALNKTAQHHTYQAVTAVVLGLWAFQFSSFSVFG